MAQKNKKLDKSMMFLIFGLIMAIVTGYLIVEGQSYYNKTVSVVCVGEVNIDPYTVIKEENLQIIKISSVDELTGKVFEKKEDVIGKVSKTMLTASSIIMKTETIDFNKDINLLAANLTSLKDKSVIAYTIPTNQVSAVGGKIMPNDKVHIIATMSVFDTLKGTRQFSSRILVPYAKVIDTVGKDAGIKGITFALKPQEVLDIEYALKNGTISFGLLPYDYDNKNVNEKTSTSEESFTVRHF